jgi:ligand-binding sensor domain-containing protein
MSNKFTLKSSTLQMITRQTGASFHARRKLLLVSLVGLCLLSFLSGVVWIRDQARRRLAEERTRIANQDFIPFEKSIRAPLARPEIKFWQNTESTRAVIRFQDSYFAATNGGMVQFSTDGQVLRHYTVLDGLTESDLLSFAVFDSKLFIGTASQGLLSFDGERFESYRWPDRASQAITAMLADGGRLLCGTFSGGLIEFDGRRFTELKAGADRTRLVAINCLVKDGSRLYVGTFNDGLWLLEAGRWLHFRSADGLASNRVVGVVASGENVFVASDFGLASATSASLMEAAPSEQKRFHTLATLPTLSGLVSYGGLLLISKDNGELLALDRQEAAARRSLPVRNLSWTKPVDLSCSRLMLVDGKLWLLGSRGIWQTQETGPADTPAQLSLARFGHASESPALTSNIISALALDADGKFWAGNFRRGIDVLSAEGKKIAHLESEAVREVNFLLAEAGREPAVLAATSQGVVRFAAQFRSTSTTKADGLPSNSVMHLSLAEGSNSAATSATKVMHNSELVLATGRGLGVNQQGNWRALTTVQGLPSDQIYTTLFFKGSLFVGTLGGLSQVESGRVVRVFKDSNSKLTHNWVTGLCAVGARLFIGTYGGGVFELAPSNELRSFAQEIGTPFVNPNAMWSDGEMLFVGTLDGAWVFDLHAQKWTHLKDELPARTVLSITGDTKFVYFGTTNGIARVEKSYLNGI